MTDWDRMAAAARELATPRGVTVRSNVVTPTSDRTEFGGFVASGVSLRMAAVVPGSGGGERAGVLVWSLGDAPTLQCVCADDDGDVDAFLDALRKVRPMGWWRARAAFDAALTDEVATSVEGAHSGVATSRKREPAYERRAMTDELLREVFEVYSAAERAGEGPTKAVQRKWGTSYGTASRWASRARALKQREQHDHEQQHEQHDESSRGERRDDGLEEVES